jgi:hypothetical protein
MKRQGKGGRSSPSKSRVESKRKAGDNEKKVKPEQPTQLLSSLRSSVKASASSPTRGIYTSFIDRVKDNHSSSVAAVSPVKCGVTSPTSPRSQFGSPLSQGSNGRNIVIPYVDGASLVQTTSPHKPSQASPQHRQKQQQKEQEEHRTLLTPRPKVVTRKDAINHFEILLNERGVNQESKVGVFVGDEELNVDSFKNYLPLHAYDDLCLESVNTAGMQLPCQGKVLVEPNDSSKGPAQWLFCVVCKYNGGDKNTFTVYVKPESQQRLGYVHNDNHFDADENFAYAFANTNDVEEKEAVVDHDTGTTATQDEPQGTRMDDVPRINLLLVDLDDPWAFADRVAQAHDRRCKAEALLRYHLYIDCMPTDDVPRIDGHTLERIFQLAVGLRLSHSAGLAQPSSTLDLQSNLDTSALEKEVQLEYSRTMNGIIFDLKLSKCYCCQIDLEKVKKNYVVRSIECCLLSIFNDPFRDCLYHLSIHLSIYISKC